MFTLLKLRDITLYPTHENFRTDFLQISVHLIKVQHMCEKQDFMAKLKIISSSKIYEYKDAQQLNMKV